MARKVTKPKSKLGRNQDGTYKKGYSGNPTGEGAGRPIEALSFRQQVKIRAAKDPKLVDDAIDTLIRIANDSSNPQCINAVDKLIKLNGGYDPAETKAEVSADVKANDRPLIGLTVDELKKLLGRSE